MLLTANIALIVFAAILILSAIISYRFKSFKKFEGGAFHIFIVVLTGLGVFVTFMFYYNVVELQNQQQQLAALQEVARLNNTIINSVLTEIQNSSLIIPNFVLSITPLTNTICCSTGSTGSSEICYIPVGDDPINAQTCSAKLSLSYRIFEMWQDVILAHTFINYNPLSYIVNFLQKANSQQLYIQWNVNKINFNNDTIIFGDLLFKYALPITNQTPEEYVSVANNLINDYMYFDRN